MEPAAQLSAKHSAHSCSVGCSVSWPVDCADCCAHSASIGWPVGLSLNQPIDCSVTCSFGWPVRNPVSSSLLRSLSYSVRQSLSRSVDSSVSNPFRVAQPDAQYFTQSAAEPVAKHGPIRLTHDSAALRSA